MGKMFATCGHEHNGMDADWYDFGDFDRQWPEPQPVLTWAVYCDECKKSYANDCRLPDDHPVRKEWGE